MRASASGGYAGGRDPGGPAGSPGGPRGGPGGAGGHRPGGRPALALTRADAGRRFSLAVGEAIAIELAENPTTGYLWEAVIDEPERLALKESSYRATSDAIGSGGVRTLGLVAAGKGEARLLLRLRRKWEGGAPPVDECTFFFSIGRRGTAANGRDE